MKKLKPCPFCGSSDVHYYYYKSEKQFYNLHIMCAGCNAYFISAGAVNDDDLIAAWNKRADEKQDNFVKALFDSFIK